MQRAFVIRPFGTKKDLAGKPIDFETIHRDLIGPALLEAGLAGSTTAEVIDAGNIREDMFGLIVGGDLVICDITVHNPNVFYELGIRHALRKKGSVMIKGRPVEETTPFDLSTDRYLAYDIDAPAKAKDELVRVVRATLSRNRDTDSPVFKLLPALREPDSSAIQLIPMDLLEEISRATAAGSPGWLRLLRSEVGGQLFRWPALRLIGRAQRSLKDYEGSRDTWEMVRENDPHDIAANLALADIYERLHRRNTKKLELLETSNLAIERVISNDIASAKEHADASALKGRNAKAVWRLAFEALPDISKRRAAALNPDLLKAYEAHYSAYLADLNNYGSALAALQMAVIMQDLAGEPEWEDLFDTTADAKAYKERLDEQVARLRPAARLAIDAEFNRYPRGHKERVRAEVSEADLLFLSGDRAKRVANAYLEGLPKEDRSAWDAVRGQLELFAGLGIKADMALQVIDGVEALIMPPPAVQDVHIVLFAGHRIDEPDRPKPRFPATLEAVVRGKIHDALAEAKAASARLKVLASGAPGSDIICHEICRQLEIESLLCLPMPPEDFASECFAQFDDWRGRFLKLVDGQTVQLSDNNDGIPRWLKASGINPWERGNQWVLEMAQSAGARKITAIALWDGKPMGDGRGGTAHMVELARKSGKIDVVVLDLPPPT